MTALANCSVLLVVGAATGACGFDRRSADYACTITPDCPDGRTCDQGWCVDGDGGAVDRDAPGAGDDGGSSPDAPAGTRVVFGETPDADVSGVTIDGWINSQGQTLNYGIDDVMRLDRNPDQNGLLRFDLSSISSGSVVTSSEVRMWTESGFNNDGVVQAFPLNEEWEEGAVDGAAGAANWDQRMAAVNWLGSGASGASHAPTASDDAPARLDGVEVLLAIPTELVQSWVDDPTLNHGWVLIPSGSSNAAATLLSSESPVEDRRPRMIIHHL